MIPKFRAWDKTEKKMHKVKTIEFSRRGARIIHLAEVQSNGKGVHKRWHSSVELMQSTGLKDKNGVEIYEGDIIHHAEKPNPFYNSPFEIIQARTGEWRLDNFRGGTVLAFSRQEELEIIGNIYETPHLLEESQ